MDSKTTQRLANPNWRPCNVTAQAMCKALAALVGAPAPVRTVATDLDAARAVTQPIPVIR